MCLGDMCGSMGSRQTWQCPGHSLPRGLEAGGAVLGLMSGSCPILCFDVSPIAGRLPSRG